MSSLGKDVDSLIISYLKDESLLAVRRVCRTWKELAEGVFIPWPIPLKFSDIRPFYDIDPKLFMLLTSGHCEFKETEGKWKRISFGSMSPFDMLNINLHLQFGAFQIKILLQSYSRNDIIYFRGGYLLNASPGEYLYLNRSEFDPRVLITFFRNSRKKFIEISCGTEKIEVATWSVVKGLNLNAYNEYKEWKNESRDDSSIPVYINGGKNLHDWLQICNADAISTAKIHAIFCFLFASHPEILETVF